MVTAMEVGGRWSEEAHYFLETLAATRASDAPRALKGSVFQASKRRWTAMVAVAGMRSLAHTLLESQWKERPLESCTRKAAPHSANW